MLIEIRFFFKDREDSFIIDKEIKFNNDWFVIESSIFEIEDFLMEVINKIEKNNIEVLICIKDRISYFEVLSVLIKNKIFIIYKFIKKNPYLPKSDYESEKIQYEFIDKKYIRKAKLTSIETNQKLDPESLWKNSWFMKFYNKKLILDI